MFHKSVYTCYLGKDMGIRLAAIVKYIKEHDGEDFFNKFSTPEDSIHDFIERCEKAGIILKEI